MLIVPLSFSTKGWHSALGAQPIPESAEACVARRSSCPSQPPLELFGVGAGVWRQMQGHAQPQHPTRPIRGST